MHKNIKTQESRDEYETETICVYDVTIRITNQIWKIVTKLQML